MLYRYPPEPLRFGRSNSKRRSCSMSRMRRAYVSEPAQAGSVRHTSRTGEYFACGISHSTDTFILKFRTGRNSSSKGFSTDHPFSRVMCVGDPMNVITGS